MTIAKTVSSATVTGKFIVVTAELREDHGSLSDGFSITGELYEKHGTWSGQVRHRHGRQPDICGCIHEEIARYLPKLQPLIDVHLAAPDGTPMHAVANGRYFYSGQARRWERKHNATYSNRDNLSDHERAADALNIKPEDLPAKLTKDEFEAFAETLRPVWAEQARVARELLVSL